MASTQDFRIDEATTRPLKPDDLEAVVAIDRRNAGLSRRGYFEKRLSAATELPRDYVYTALGDGDRLLGFAFAKLVDGAFGQPGASAALDAIGVDAVCQLHGAGRKLLDSVESVLARKGVTRLTTQVDWADRALLGFLGRAGFELDNRMVLTRTSDEIPPELEEDLEEPLEIDHSAAESDDPAALARDRIPVRSMTEADLAAMITIDRRSSGQDRSAYYERRQHEALNQSGVQISLVAELDDHPVGFIMARVDFGEFGRSGDEAVMDAIGVDPGYRGRGVGRALMSQLMANLTTLRVANVRTELAWNDTGLIAYLDATGFAPAQRVTLCKTL